MKTTRLSRSSDSSPYSAAAFARHCDSQSHKARRWLAAAALIAALAACATALLDAEVPQLINHQGRIAVGGTNFNGSGQFKFALVDGGIENSVQATATATIEATLVTTITVTNSGAGYTSAPAVTISGGGGSGATATANVSGGSVVSITVTNPGSDYAIDPDVLIDPPPSSVSYVTYWSNDGTSTAGSEPSAAVSLTVTKGLYSVLLGDTSLTHMTAVPATVFNNTDVRLRVWFNDGTTGFQQLSPDQRIASVGYAMMATGVPDGAITAAKIATGAVGDSQVGTLSQSEITNLTTDLAGKVARSGGDTLTGNYIITGTLDTGQGANELYAMDQNLRPSDNPTFATVNTGNGPNELYAMNQNVLTTSNPTFATLNTGQGANELHAMNQNVLTTSSPTFANMTVTGSASVMAIDTGNGANELYAMNQNVLTTSSPTFNNLNTGQGAYELYAMDQNVRTIDSPTFNTLNTGPGATELYGMNQNVRTTDTPTFLGLTSTGLVTVQGDLKVIESVGGSFYGTLDVGDLSGNATYTFSGNSGTVMTTANGGSGSNFNADFLDGFSSSAFATTTHTHDAGNIVSGLLSDARLSSNVALLDHANIFGQNMQVNNRIGIGRSASANALEVAGDASKNVAGDWLANSDRRIKQDIRAINGALDTLDKVRLVDFRYTDEYRSAHPGIEDRRYINVVAQEFAEVFPDHVKPSGEFMPDGSAILQVDTYPLTIYSAAAVQELHAATIALQKENVDLKARVEALEALLTNTPVQNLADKHVTEKTP